jgi:hypothetical protein
MPDLRSVILQGKLRHSFTGTCVETEMLQRLGADLREGKMLTRLDGRPSPGTI